MPYTPNNFAKVEIWDLCYDGAGTRLVKGDVVADDVLNVINKGGKLDETLDVVKYTDGSVVWLEKGYNKQLENGKWTGQGWDHIKGKHITGDIPGGSKFTISMSETDVQTFIYDTIQKNQVTEQGIRKVFTQNLPAPDGRVCKVVVEDGKIITAYPVGVV